MGMKVNGTSGLTFPDTTTLASAGQASVRAWVNFNGTGTVAIRAAFNVTSITDNGTGDYTVNFTTALPDADYSALTRCGTGTQLALGGTSTASSHRFSTGYVSSLGGGSAAQDAQAAYVAIFR